MNSFVVLLSVVAAASAGVVAPAAYSTGLAYGHGYAHATPALGYAHGAYAAPAVYGGLAHANYAYAAPAIRSVAVAKPVVAAAAYPATYGLAGHAYGHGLAYGGAYAAPAVAAYGHHAVAAPVAAYGHHGFAPAYAGLGYAGHGLAHY